MEPFGLFQILQSFLTQAPENAPKSEAEERKENDERSENSAQASAQTSAQKEEIAEASFSTTSPNQAFLSFMQAHESRAKRIKKP